ncbi:Protein PHLOEM PROTEIN 2-LIKE A1 [Linum grandiflorum]
MGTSWSQDDEAAAGSIGQPINGQDQLQRKQSEAKSNSSSGRATAAASNHQPIIHGQDQLQRQYSGTKHSGGQGQLQRQYSAQKQSDEKQTPKQSETRNRASAVMQVKLPHNWEAILRDADTPIDRSSAEKMYNQLSHGKYWVDRNSNSNCFTLFARDLLITWADDPYYWHWLCVADTRDVKVEAAEVLAVCWLEVHGNFDTAKLSPGILYEVVYEIMLKDKAVGWEVPVNFRLTLPNGVKQEHKENLMTKPRMQWIEIPVGEFRTSSDKNNGGVMEISMYEYEGGTWKNGIVVKGVTIRPKNSTAQAIGVI